MHISKPEFLYLGDDNKFSVECNDDFELIKKQVHRSPSVIYVDRSSNDSKVTEIGRCVIGNNWATPWLYVPFFEIAKPYRRQGYGKDFFYELMDFAQWKGFSYIWLTPKNNNKSSSLEFWRCMGGVRINDLDNVDSPPVGLDNEHLIFDLNEDCK